MRDRIRAGDSNQQVLDFVVARYGEYVLLRPPLGWHTALLWAGPFLVFAGGVAGLVMLARRRREAAMAGEGLSGEERAEIDRILGKG